MRHLRCLSSVYSLLIAQMMLPSLLSLNGVTPDIAFVGLIVFAWFTPGRAVLVWGVVLGFFLDCLAPHGMGAHVIACTGLVAAVQVLRQHPALLSPVVFVPLCTLLIGGALVFTNTLQVWDAAQSLNLPNVFRMAGLSALYSSVLGCCLVEVGRGIASFLGRRLDPATADVANRWTMLTD